MTTLVNIRFRYSIVDGDTKLSARLTKSTIHPASVVYTHNKLYTLHVYMQKSRRKVHFVDTYYKTFASYCIYACVSFVKR